MIDLLAEIYDLNTWTTLYAWIYFGIALKLLIDFSSTYSFTNQEKVAETTGLQLSVTKTTSLPPASNSVIKWIGKYIKRKFCSTDDPEAPLSLLSS
ncbi:hypothetical protein D1B31_06235 [Neobacillus notoginsengisoli]|uniref:Uncharacterized protein n=1 Tax=Neobacillus notoginsengisoli TaxID=1578198 RepID=A0A417YXX5_9BACI|nr:hypothetical protein [Neobacillus notoginsengisoli]RHW42222.1 hypothetical protein D1B31_06235 [Neobacillus notoginsengisoli]